MKKNIFVFGLNDFNREQLESLQDADQYQFHGLIALEKLKDAVSYDFPALLVEAQEQLDSFNGPIDAIINFWDFPSSVLHPFLCERYQLPGPSLKAAILCGNKGLSREAQQSIIPDYIPKFSIFDPFEDNPFQKIALDFPFWIKPLLSYSGYLGFKVASRDDFSRYLQTIRKNIDRFAEPYADLLQHADLDPSLTKYTAHHCIAEEIISAGRQCTVEGYSYHNQVECYGIIDSVRYPNMVSFSRYQYPSRLPESVKQKINAISKTIIEYIGFDQSAFNIEYFYDEATDRLRLLEINSRISQSHGLLFKNVDGASNHRIVLDLGLGNKPRFPHHQGRYACAAKIFARRFEDALVTRVPTSNEIDHAQQLVPGATIVVPVKQERRLSELLDQDSYSYQYVIAYLGGDNIHDLARSYKRIRKALPFKFKSLAGNANVS
ncbi:Biotin carboxylase [Nitrosomonas marina]|uniref:Biotin carboxylase n=1 Tax=Nitrosomonas marina TaxID=917 RepID=A0A1I0C8I3_9PROT|nr:hypothetical protein [Nitrosomonas marina]SET15543.1 Biotin carboxylase [Nitrosomonas marina]